MIPDISISYHNEEIANKVRAAFNGTPVYCKQSLEYKDSLKNHREKLGKSHCIILIVCDDYLKSSECLAELLEVYKNGSFGERVFPVISKDAEIHNPIYHADCIRHLENEINEIEKSLRGLGSSANLKSIHDYLDSHVDWRKDLSNIFSILKNINTKNIDDIRKDNYNIIVNAVLKRRQQIAAINTPEEIERPKKIPIERIYLCNRKDQFNTFLNALQDQKSINTFYVHGDEMHGHDQMFERFCNHLKGSYRTREQRNRKEIRTLNIDFSTIASVNFRVVLLSKFLDALGMDLHQYTPSNPITNEKLHAVCKKSNYIKPLKANDIIAINFRIPGGEWFEGLTDEIEWFINDFCNGESLPDNTPTFHFFFSVVYSRANSFKHFFRGRKLKRHKENIIKSLSNTFVPNIDELSWVKADDIDNWLSVIGIENIKKREQLMTTKFKADSRQGYYMSNLKSILTSVINDHANNKL